MEQHLQSITTLSVDLAAPDSVSPILSGIVIRSWRVSFLIWAHCVGVSSTCLFSLKPIR